MKSFLYFTPLTGMVQYYIKNGRYYKYYRDIKTGKGKTIRVSKLEYTAAERGEI